MCKNAQEKYCNRSKKTMIFCKLKNDNKSELEQLCLCQRFCSDEDKYIPYNQKDGCKKYV